MIMIVVSSTTMSCAPAMMTRIHRWARCVALSAVPATSVLQRGHRLARARVAAGGSWRERNRSSWFWPSGRCANSASVGRMPAISRLKMPLPRLGCVRAGGLEHAPDRPQGERDVGAPQVEAHAAVRLRVGEQAGDQLACRLHEVVIGDPQLGQAAEVLRLIRTRLLQEVLEPGAVGPRRRVVGQGDGGLEDVRDQCLDETPPSKGSGGRACPCRRRPRGPRRPRWPRAPCPRRLEPAAASRRSRFFRASLRIGRITLVAAGPLRASAGPVSGDFTPLTIVVEAERAVHFSGHFSGLFSVGHHGAWGNPSA